MRQLLVLALLFVASPVAAQQLAWNEDAKDAPTAQSYIYKYYVNGSSAGIPLNGVTCTGTATPFSCLAPFNPTGVNNIALTASSGTYESNPSVLLILTAIPTGLKVIKTVWMHIQDSKPYRVSLQKSLVSVKRLRAQF